MKKYKENLETGTRLATSGHWFGEPASKEISVNFTDPAAARRSIVGQGLAVWPVVWEPSYDWKNGYRVGEASHPGPESNKRR